MDGPLKRGDNLVLKRTIKKTLSASNIKQFDNRKGVYEIIDKKGKSIYIGKSNNIGRRIREHLKTGIRGAYYFRTYSRQGVSAEKLENKFIKQKKPTKNIRAW